jgi:hypothetical protein
MTEITAAMVLEVTTIRASTAERAAAYLTRRLTGQLSADARREVGIGEDTGRRYELLLPAVCERYGLPYPHRRAHGFHPHDWTTSGVSGAPQTHHVGRGVTNPDYPHCPGVAP